MDLRQRVVMLDGEVITLTTTQYRLLALLVEQAGKVVPRAIIMTQIWGYAPETHTQKVTFRPIHRDGRRGGIQFPTTRSVRTLSLLIGNSFSVNLIPY